MILTAKSKKQLFSGWLCYGFLHNTLDSFLMRRVRKMRFTSFKRA